MQKRRLIFGICVCLVIMVVAGCDTDRVIFQGPYFVRFTEDSGFDKESFTGEVDIEVHNGGPALDEDVNIGYTIGGTARQGIDYTILDEPKTVVIPAGEYFGNIRIKLINNANNILRSQTIVFTILTTNRDGLQVGQGESGIGKAYTFTIFDDCILGGSYSGKQTGAGGSSYTGITMISQDCENYTLSDWNLGVFNTSVTMDLKLVDNGDNTLTIPQQEEEELDDDLATIVGTGVVDPVTRQILLKITLVDFDDKPEVSLTLNPQ